MSHTLLVFLIFSVVVVFHRFLCGNLYYMQLAQVNCVRGTKKAVEVLCENSVASFPQIPCCALMRTFYVYLVVNVIITCIFLQKNIRIEQKKIGFFFFSFFFLEFCIDCMITIIHLLVMLILFFEKLSWSRLLPDLHGEFCCTYEVMRR